MKRTITLLCVVLSLLFVTTAFAQIAETEAISAVENLGLLKSIDDSFLNFDEFKAAVAAAWPGKEAAVPAGSEEVSRTEFVVKLVEILELQTEAAAYEEVTAMANDEDKVSAEAAGAFSVAYKSSHQLLNYRYGHLIDPEAPITKKEAAVSFYMALNPPKQGGIATTAVMADAPGFNTLFTSSGLTWTICNLIGDGITGTNQDGFYIPRMVKEMPSFENGLMKLNDDGSMTITYNLRKGMKWHDGAPVTANDAKFQWEVMTSDAPVTSNYFEGSVDEVTVIDDYTYSIHLPNAMGNAELGSSVYAYYFGWFQLPEHIFKESFEAAKASGEWDEFVQNATKNPVMTGPYKFKEYVEGQYVILEAFDDYYMGRPNIDQLVMKIIPDSDVVFASTLNGEIDFGRYTLSLKQSIQLENEHGDLFNVFFTKNVAEDTFNLNFRDPEDPSKPNKFFTDIRVRQAILYAINRDQINKVVYYNKGTVVDTWITDLHQMREALKGPEVKKYSYDIKKAKELLAEAGWKLNKKGILEKDGIPFEFSVVTMAGSAEQTMTAQILQGMLKQVGISLKIDSKPGLVVWTELMPYGKYDAMLTGWGYGVTDDAANYWSTDAIPTDENSWGGTNYDGWSNKENDEIITAAAQELDMTKKAELYKKHFEIWTEELPVLPIVSSPTPHFAKKNIKSFNSGYDNGLGWIIQNWYIGE